jgi:hypothetical protein
MEKWLNGTISDSTGYAPLELILGQPRPDLFRKFLTKKADELPSGESTQQKALKAYARMKEKSVRRNKRRMQGRTQWNPQVGDLVLVKRQATADAVAGVTSKFIQLYQGPLKVAKLIPPSMYEIVEIDGKMRGVFNKEAMKPYLQDE